MEFTGKNAHWQMFFVCQYNFKANSHTNKNDSAGAASLLCVRNTSFLSSSQIPLLR
jgi:hypothetical protein